MQLYIGTSGWAYPHWQGPFYPPELPEPEWLSFYARHFGSVEVNRSFYRLPSRENFAAWREATPEGFVFAIKASRYITHFKKLQDPRQTLPPLLEAAEGLAHKRGPLLFQLPPRWRANPGRLEAFLQALPVGIEAAFELRDPSWHTPQVIDLLTRFHAAFCVFDIGGFQSPRVMSADFLYLRLHGPGAPYCGRYGHEGLADWAAWITRQKARTAYVYFDNDQYAYAVQDALELKAMLG